MGNTGGLGNRKGTGKHEQAAWLHHYPCCGHCGAGDGDVCRTPAGTARAPHMSRDLLVPVKDTQVVVTRLRPYPSRGHCVRAWAEITVEFQDGSRYRSVGEVFLKEVE